MAKGDTLLNAGIGAVVTVVLSFTMFSPLIGGAVASYLQREDSSSGVRVGALSGALAALPFLLFVFFVGGFVFAGPMFGGPGGMGVPGGFAVLLLVGFFFALVWSVGLGALGGYVGVYLRNETDIGS
jgi:hypothetical protein